MEVFFVLCVLLELPWLNNHSLGQLSPSRWICLVKRFKSLMTDRFLANIIIDKIWPSPDIAHTWSSVHVGTREKKHFRASSKNNYERGRYHRIFKTE